MMDKQKLNPQTGKDKLYIRYRIYAQKADKSGMKYPQRVIRSISNLHYNILKDNLLWTREYTKESINTRLFIPENLIHVNPKYFGLIRAVTIYFDCYAKWTRVLIPGTIERINTFRVVGYDQDVRLAFHYLNKLINNLGSMRNNIGNTDNTSLFFYSSLYNIQFMFEAILEGTHKQRELKEKLSNVEFYIKTKELLDYRKFQGDNRANIKNAYSRVGIFQNNRIIR